MKTAIFGSYHSKYALSKAIKIPYVTVQRRVLHLKKLGMIRLVEKARKKDATKDMRGGQRWALTFRGLVYLILNGNLEEKELTRAITELLHGLKLDFSKVPEWRFLVVQSIKDAIFKMKSQINFQFFDSKYVANLFGSLVMEGIKLRSLSNSSLRKIGKCEAKRLLEKSGRKEEVKRFFRNNLKHFKLVKRNAEENIRICEETIKFIQD